MGNHCSKCVKYTDASSPTISRQQRHGKSVELQSEQRESESPHLLPSSDSLEKIDVPSASGAISDPCASYTSVIGNNYYVFLSFRGPDTRKGFVDHLYHRLKDVDLPFHPNFVFRDYENLPFGMKIGENLISAIKHSKVSIPVISEKYAANEWCLRELIQIMECEERGEQKVLPVLYKVKPHEVRELKGAFGKAYKSRKNKCEEEVKQQGLLALKKAVGLRVFESEKFANGHEAELIKELVRVIMDEQRHNFLPPLPGNLVGIEDRVDEVMKLVGIAHPDTRIIWIWGIGGIGKTTLATSIYNKLVDKFQCRSFLRDIEETIRNKGIEHVQSRLISDTLEIHDHVARDPDTRINIIRSNCAQKKVLFVLDNVDHQDHLNKLIGGCKFRSGSRIIVTSHMAIKCLDKAMSESTYLYELKEMNYFDSLLLFSIHAFEGKPRPKELATLSCDIVATTGGHPLALEVIGSLLNETEDQRVWRETLKELSKAPHMTVQQKLKVSYDALKYEEQQMFLDIACFWLELTKESPPTYGMISDFPQYLDWQEWLNFR
ncbi:TMV resistance protein N-like [Eucalyptus grandis]|uniref:TMV resistance protein N-like n=1 Tax=Eucalyptus grandis TaxID=71139 RepID=UPI00192EF873|nr:TMV resistance protein N-like [Eucalyptus grandis]